MTAREVLIDVGWVLLVVVLLPFAIPLALVAFIVIGVQRLFLWKPMHA